ncbi:hypothetical protein LIER_34757 [Lithospermum erythrorhizon]|uniref:Auxin-repressed protein n=1 Tax=Lithospermum erythrorhizon TaxID=34254 RepID=A0AAV3S2I2_LITER
MVFLDHVWDDVIAGPQPERGLGKLRKDLSTKPLNIKALGEGSSNKSLTKPSSSPGTPSTPTTPSPTAAVRKENVWRSVFHPGSNLATKSLGGQLFDQPLPNSPTVYDWLYSGETKSKHF